MKHHLALLSYGLITALALATPETSWSNTTTAKPSSTASAKAKPKKAKKVARKTRAPRPAAPVAAAATVPVLAAQAQAASATQPEPATAPLPGVSVAAPAQATPYVNPYLAYQPQAVALPNPVQNINQLFNTLKLAMPILPNNGQAILPVIKTVYPTGEKPLVVITFKCPTELIGVTPLPTKALHELVNTGMDAINNTNVLSFNLQQVCS